MRVIYIVSEMRRAKPIRRRADDRKCEADSND